MSTTAVKTDTDPLQEWQRTRALGAKAHRCIFPAARRRGACLPLARFLPSPISIPEGKSGGIRVTHRVLTEATPIIGARQALLRGVRPVRLSLDASGPLTIHELRDAHAGVWMTDLPEELHQIAEMIRDLKPRGRVLVGGLGLGLVAHFLARLRGVNEVVIVERNPHVIKLIKPHLPARKVAVVQDDIARYLRYQSAPAHDFYLLDTWQGTSESTWWGEVMPLKRFIRRNWGDAPRVHCWAEDIMAGQVLEKLVSARRNWVYEKLPPNMTPAEAAYFFTRVGEPEWERKYGGMVGGKA